MMAYSCERAHIQRGTDRSTSAQMVRVPRRVPLARLRGATPTKAAICCRLRVPSSVDKETCVDHCLKKFEAIDEAVLILVGVILYGLLASRGLLLPVHYIGNDEHGNHQ
jgi:hypothetical protein